MRRIAQMCVLGFTVATGSALAQVDAAAEPALQLPASPAAWVNSGPFSLKSLEGKGVVLYFYEEGCPRCAGKWPEMLATAAKHRGEPVVFVAVNSGNSRREVESYVRRHRISWPVIVDADRSLERAAVGSEVSLSNIWQVRYLTASGELQTGNAGNLEQTIKQALEGAAWRVDPAIVPERLQAAWISVELGDYPSAASAVKRALGSGDEQTRSAAEKLNGAVLAEMTEELQAAEQAKQSGDAWTAYQTLLVAEKRYKGYDLPGSVKTDLAELKSSAEVREETKHQKKLVAAKKALASGNARGMKRAMAMLKKLVESAPSSAAAREAGQLLSAMPGGPASAAF